MIRASLTHLTEYEYDRPVALSPHVVRLRPAPHCRTPILSYSLKVEPAGHFINWQQDPFANHLARLVFPEKTTEFKVTVDVVAEMAVYNPFDFFLEPEAEKFPFRYAPELAHDLAPYLAKDKLTPRFGTALTQHVVESGCGLWWVCGEKHSLDAMRQPSSTRPQFFPSWVQVFGVQPRPHWFGIPPPPQLSGAMQEPQSRNAEQPSETRPQ